MRKLILTCLCLFLTQTAESSNYYYPSYRYSYPVYQPPVVYNNTYYQPYAVPLYTAAYAPQTAVISGSVAYQQAITTLATAGAATQVQSTVQGVLGAEVQQQQQLTFEQRLDRLMAIMEAKAGIAVQSQQQLPPHVQVFRQHCSACHTGASAKANFQLFAQDGSYQQPTQEMIGNVLYRISTSDQKLRMPPNGAIPYEDHKRLIEGMLTQQPQKQAEAKQPPPQKAEQPAPLPPDPKKTEGPF